VFFGAMTGSNYDAVLPEEKRWEIQNANEVAKITNPNIDLRSE